MSSLLKQRLTLYRPGDIPRIVEDPTYDQFGGFKGVFPDDEVPSQETLLNTDASKLTSVLDWHYYGAIAGLDYESVRAFVRRAMLASGGYSALDDESQRACCTYFFHELSAPDYIKHYSIDELDILAREYDTKATQSRSARYETGKLTIFKLLEGPDAQKVANDILEFDLDRKYVQAGIRGIGFGRDFESGLLNYIDAFPGSAYSENGLRKLGFEPKQGLTLDQFCSIIIGIAMKDLID